MWRGTLVFELFQLAGYWGKTLSRGPHDMDVEKISFGAQRKQYLMLFSPQNIDPQKPLIIYYHGGGWIFGKPELFIKKAVLFTQLGYQVVMPSYRKLPLYTGADILEDVSLTLSTLQRLRTEGKIKNLDRIILGGVSAGASLSSLIYFDKPLHEKAGFKQAQFEGLFLYAPPMDLSKMNRTPVLHRYAGAISSDLFNRINPINYVADSKPLPILCVHGNKDGLVKIDSSRAFRDLYHKIHPGNLKYHELENATHLDAASWAHTDNDLRAQLFAYLKSVT